MRLRVVAWATVASAVAKAFSVATSLVAIPLVFAHLGNERFGMWMTIASLPSFLAFMDFGIGNGVLNSIAIANGNNDRARVRQALANGLALLAMVSVLAAIAFLATWPWVNWAIVLGIKLTSAAEEEARLSMLALGVVFFISIPATIAQRAFFGLQKGVIGGLWQIVANLCSFAGVLLVLELGLAIPSLVLAMFGVPAVVAIVSAMHLIARNPDLAPRRADLDKRVMRTFAETGASFFLMQVGGAIAFSSDQLVISHRLGLAEVAQFSIFQKLFAPVSLMLSFVLTPLWAAYADAFAKGDLTWIRTILIKSTTLAGVSAATLGVLTAVFSDYLLQLWMGKSIQPDFALAACLAGWLVLDSVGRCISIFLNGVGVLKPQVLVTFAFVPLCIGLKLWFATWLGLYGVPLAVCTAYAITHIPAYGYILTNWFSTKKPAGA